MSSSQVLMEGWLTRSRDHSMRFPPFRSKWVRRYFVLRDDGIATNRRFFLDEYRDENKKRLRKSIDMSRCEQVDSYLQLADTSCSARFTLFQWIFSIHLVKPSSKKITELYMVAKSEMEMSDWVSELCHACGLEKQPEPGELVHPFVEENGDMLPHLPSFRGMSISSDISSESLMDRTISDVTSEGIVTGREMYQNQKPLPYFHLKNVRVKTDQERARPVEIVMTDIKYKNHNRNASTSLPRAASSASGCSSMTSSHRSIQSEDDASSMHSSQSLGTMGVPPVPPRSRRLANQLSNGTATSSSQFGSRTKVPDLGQTVPAPTCEIVEERENESSGETIKMHHTMNRTNHVFPSSQHQQQNSYTMPGSGSVSKASSVSSSMAYGPIRGPPVDRSKKPSKLRLEREDDLTSQDGSISYSTYGNSSTLTRAPRTPQLPKVTPRHRVRDPPKSAGPLGMVARSRELDYFEPAPQRHPFERVQSTRSPDPVDLDYIQIDADKTQAVKNLIATSSRRTYD